MISKDYIQQAIRTESRPDISELFDTSRETELGKQIFHVRVQRTRLLHAAIGLVTESAELMDALKKHLFYGKPLDEVNLQEEVGDLFWYLAILFDAMGWDPAAIMDQNIAKLRKRYPQKFEAEQALNRDLEAERKVLEQDLVLYGNAFKDSEGRRVDPLQVQVHGPLICSVCGEVQVSSRAYRKTPSGWVCKNGHGGAPSMGEAE